MMVSLSSYVWKKQLADLRLHRYSKTLGRHYEEE